MKRTRAAWATTGLVVALLTVVGCAEYVTGSGTAARTMIPRETTTSSSSSSSTSSSSSSSTSTSTEAENEFQAPVADDLLWDFDDLSSDWTVDVDGEGYREWVYRGTECRIGVYQPAELSHRSPEPTDLEIAEDYTVRIAHDLERLDADVIDEDGREFDVTVVGDTDQEIPDQIDFAGRHVKFETDDAEAQVYAYRNDDYGLIVAFLCTGGQFEDNLDILRTTLEGLKVELTYN